MLAVVFHVNWNKFGTKVQTNNIMEVAALQYKLIIKNCFRHVSAF